MRLVFFSFDSSFTTQNTTQIWMKTHSKRIDFQKRTAEGQNGEEERECELNDDDKGVGNAEEDERIEEVEDAPEDEEDGEIDFSKQRPNCTKSPLLATQI